MADKKSKSLIVLWKKQILIDFITKNEKYRS